LVDLDIQKLARQIHHKHREAIEFIIDHIPDVRQEIRDIIELVVKEYPPDRIRLLIKIFHKVLPPRMGSGT
jgi:hypothetical protein